MTAIHDTSNRPFDRKLARILSSAARVFARDGYGGASIRAVAGDAEVSLAGLYHYVKSKEELLYLIQLHTFRALVDNLHDVLEGLDDPRARFVAAVRNHLEHFVAHMPELKVCAVELDTLSGGFYDEVAVVRREYFKAMLELVDALRSAGVPGPDARLATLSLFGSLNWPFQWYDPDRDLDAEGLADEFASLFVDGFSPLDG
jgi:AcrR family transcriptional regulator